MCGTWMEELFQYFELSKCKLPCCIHSQTCESHSNMFGAVKNAKKVYKKGWGRGERQTIIKIISENHKCYEGNNIGSCDSDWEKTTSLEVVRKGLSEVTLTWYLKNERDLAFGNLREECSCLRNNKWKCLEVVSSFGSANQRKLSEGGPCVR